MKLYRFSGEDDSVSTHEHIVRFKGGCGETSENPYLLLRQFPLSLTGAAFKWYSQLRPDSVHSWNDMEAK